MSSARWWRRYCLRHREKNRSKIILGIDPGSIICGYGVVSTERLNTSYVASGKMILSPKSPLQIRLKELYDGLVDIIKEYAPDEVAVEKIFFAKSVKSALTLGHARGAILVAAASCGLPVYEYSALEVKKAIVGYGRAEKHQVQGMVSNMLNLRFKLSPDSADALALALCHTNTLRPDR